MCAKMRNSGASETEIKQQVLKTLFLKNTIFSPGLLAARGIPVTRVEQAAGEFIVTFPRSYHAGFSHGINLGEAVNFAMTEWYEFGCDAALRMAFLGKPPVRTPSPPTGTCGDFCTCCFISVHSPGSCGPLPCCYVTACWLCLWRLAQHRTTARHLRAARVVSPPKATAAVSTPLLLQALPMDQITCIDAYTLSETLKASADMSQGADRGFRQWLLESGAAAVPPHAVPLIVAFCRIIRWHHRHMSALLLDGMAMDRQAIEVSVPCCVTAELMHVVAVMPADTHQPVSLRHWLASGRDGNGPVGRKGTILLHEKWEVYHELAQLFCELCMQQV